MKILIGKVISVKAAKTARVMVDSASMHPLYGKRFIVSKSYLVHNEIGADTGDTVSFVASKPYSKMKKWKLLRIIDGDTKEKKGTHPKAKDVALENPEKIQNKGRKEKLS